MCVCVCIHVCVCVCVCVYVCVCVCVYTHTQTYTYTYTYTFTYTCCHKCYLNNYDNYIFNVEAEKGTSKFSALEYLLYKVTIQRTFQQCHRCASGHFRGAQLLRLALELVHSRRERVQSRREAVRHGVCVCVTCVCVCVCVCVRARARCLRIVHAWRQAKPRDMEHMCVYAYPSAACC